MNKTGQTTRVLLVCTLLLTVAATPALAAVLVGTKGDDAIGTYNDPAVRDVVSCGAGYDTVFFADGADLISDDCEEADRGL